MPINTMKAMAGSSENPKVHYNPRAVPKPPKKHQRLVFQFIEWCNISVNDLDASYPRPTSCALLGFMERVIIALLKDITQLIYIGRTHNLFYHEVFRTGLFLNYRETMGTFCSTSVNPVSQSQKAKLSHFQVNSPTCTMMLRVAKRLHGFSVL